MTVEVFKQLHDATLLGVHCTWATGEVRLELEAVLAGARASTRVVVLAKDASLLRWPRKLPWGPSVSVNEIKTCAGQDGATRLEMEMQSGDVIEVEARFLSVELGS